MHAIEAARKSPATIDCDHTITEAANAMDRLAVGALVVVESDGRPVGIVTDRDLVIRAVARRFSPDARVDSVMSTDLITLAPDADLRDALKVFEDHAIRRLPLVADVDEVRGGQQCRMTGRLSLLAARGRSAWRS